MSWVQDGWAWGTSLERSRTASRPRSGCRACGLVCVGSPNGFCGPSAQEGGGDTSGVKLKVAQSALINDEKINDDKKRHRFRHIRSIYTRQRFLGQVTPTFSEASTVATPETPVRNFIYTLRVT